MSNWNCIGTASGAVSYGGIFISPQVAFPGITIPANCMIIAAAQSIPGASTGGSIQTWLQATTDTTQLKWYQLVDSAPPNGGIYGGGVHVFWAYNNGGSFIANITATCSGIPAEVDTLMAFFQGGDITSPFDPGSGNPAIVEPTSSIAYNSAAFTTLNGQPGLLYINYLNSSNKDSHGNIEYPVPGTGWTILGEMYNPATNTNAGYQRFSQIQMGLKQYPINIINAPVPILQPGPALTIPNALIVFALTTNSFGLTNVGVACCIGHTYTSQGQILRPVDARDTGAQNGPALAKTRRHHMFGALMAGAIYGTLSFGTLFSKLRPANFKQPNGTPYLTNTLFEGTHWETLEDGYSFDGMICWQIGRPLPANVSALVGFVHTQDR